MKTSWMFAAAAAMGVAAPAGAAGKAKPAGLCNAKASAAIEKGWSQADSMLMDDSRKSFQSAMAADPKCVEAKLGSAWLAPQADRKKLLDEAEALAPSDDRDQALLAMQKADFAGDPAGQLAAAQKYRDAHPDDYRANLWVAIAAQPLDKWDVSLEAAQKAEKQNPKAGMPYNLEGYAFLNQQKFDDSVAAFRKYAQVAPKDANAHDSLADALLASGKLAEAGAEYQKAIDVSKGKFWQSYDGVATVKAMQGDFAGAHAALDKQVAAAALPQQKAGATRFAAWIELFAGKQADADKLLEKSTSFASDSNLPVIAHFNHAAMLSYQDKHADAAAALQALSTEVDALSAPGMKHMFGAMRQGMLARELARSGKADEVAKTVAALEASVGQAADPAAATSLALAHGAAAVAKNDLAGAVAAYKTCNPHAFTCLEDLMDAQAKAGDAAGAAATRAALLSRPDRGPEFVGVYLKLKASEKPAAATR